MAYTIKKSKSTLRQELQEHVDGKEETADEDETDVDLA